jgi:hypothetical protein
VSGNIQNFVEILMMAIGLAIIAQGQDYSVVPGGKMRMNFGLINMRGGEMRLNVAFSRAKHHMAVVSSIHHREITNDYNEGTTRFKHYHRYAEAVSLPRA